MFFVKKVGSLFMFLLNAKLEMGCHTKMDAILDTGSYNNSKLEKRWFNLKI